ncbi:MAG: sugar phosphate isomerase/epimerase family protein [Syntrophobacter sp.]
MRLSFSTNAFVKHPLAEAIGMIAGVGYSGVEILADVPHLYPFSVTEGDVDDVAAALRESRLEVANINANTAVGYYGQDFWEPLFEPSLANPDREARKWRIKFTKMCVDMAHRLSCPNVSITSGRIVAGVRPEKAMTLLKKSLEEVLVYAEARGVRVGMEYEPGLLIECFEELKELIDAIGAPHFGANLDLGHSNVLGEDPGMVIKEFSPKLFHIHLEDIRARKHYHLTPGEGDMDFRPIFGALDGVGYSGFVTVELYTYPDAPVQAAKRAFEYLKHLDSELHRDRI